MNASRIPGQYIYPVQRYNPNPIEEVRAADSRNAHAEALQAARTMAAELYRPSGLVHSITPGGSQSGATGINLDLWA